MSYSDITQITAHYWNVIHGHKGSVDTQTMLGGLTIYPRVANFLQCICATNYENWLAVDKVITQIIRLTFFGPPCKYALIRPSVMCGPAVILWILSTVVYISYAYRGTLEILQQNGRRLLFI